MIRDHHGLHLSGASAEAIDLNRQALHAYLCYAGDAPGLIQRAIDDSPGFVMGHVLKAWLHLLGADNETQSIGLQAAQSALTLSAQGLAGAREQAHVAALGAFMAGEVRGAARILEDVSIAHPRDILALQVGSVLDFLLGDSRMLRDRIGRVTDDWTVDMPDYHAVLGMLAFGLEETGQYDKAEKAGMAALSLEPRNGWAWHAVAHVMEMQDRRQEGVAFLRSDLRAWTEDSFFAIHNWWHLGLFHLGLGETEEVLALFDGPIFGPRSAAAFDLVDASALLWRLNLAGVDVGARWAAVADVYETQARGGYAFDDAHAMLAFTGSGRRDQARALLATQEAVLAGTGDNVGFTRDVGLPVMKAIDAFGQGDFAGCAELLRPVRSIAHRFGGSHAQRDLIDLTLIEAARRSGDTALERALRAERSAAKPSRPDRDLLLAA